MNEVRMPSYFSTLQAPYRLQFLPAVRSLLARYGPTAVRLWFVTIANPGVLYSTNPSTIATFLEDLNKDWMTSSRLIRDWSRNPEAFDPELIQIAKRLDSRGSSSRLRRIAGSAVPLPFECCAPAVDSYICWTGGYVKPFLDRIDQYLPPQRYRLIPMYSMSTETIETIAHFHKGGVSFLPIAHDVLYEFIELGKADDPVNLLSARKLQPGKRYSMIVSDNYGLRRYQTEDLFHCCGTIHGQPDLTFVGRRGLEYSFTGEKLTLDHASKVIHKLAAEYNCRSSFLTLVPSQVQPSSPHYKLVVVEDASAHTVARKNGIADELPMRCDQLLSEVNCEYKSKRESGRLGPVQIVQVSMQEFLNKMKAEGAWDTQFKFLPFYRREWV
jgi:hypothetical protein